MAASMKKGNPGSKEAVHVSKADAAGVMRQEHRIRIRLRSYDHKMLDESAARIVEIVRRTGGIILGPILLPTQRKLYTVLRSPHTDKKSREQFELKIHKRLIDLKELNPKTIDELMKLDLPPGVDVEIKL